MNILLLLGEIGFISRNNIIIGVTEEAKKDGNDVYLFTCEGFAFHSHDTYSAGEYEIFKLPCFDNYDGVIVDFNSIHDDGAIEYIKENISRLNMPCISISQEYEKGITISYDYSAEFAELVEHLIVEHGYRNIHMLTGPRIDKESIVRRDIFEHTLKKHNIPVYEDNIFYGDFNIGSGKKLAYEYVSKGNLPDAIVCGNDLMAIGLIEAFEENEIKCPDDVAITGFDNCDSSQMMQPRLTTIDTNEREVGVRAYHAVISLINGEELDKELIINSHMIQGESCGCRNLDISNSGINSYVHGVSKIDQSLDLIKSINICCEEVTSMFGFEQAITPYIYQMGIEYLYYCQCGSRESYYHELEMYAENNIQEQATERSYEDYDDTVWCPIACEKGEWSSFSAYSMKELLPPDRKRSESTYYIIMPVHKDKNIIGYLVIGNFNGSISGRILQHLVLEFNHVISNLRNSDITNTMLASVNKKWQYDELTEIYNRSGFYHRILSLFEYAKDNHMGFMVIFFDLDGLKRINDAKGHKAGDEYIRSMAKVLDSLSDEHTVVARFGGDEFILASLNTSLNPSLKKSNEIKELIEKQVSASMGMAFGYVYNQIDFNTLIQSADTKMYINKLERKNSR